MKIIIIAWDMLLWRYTAILFGISAGTIVGFLGVILYCLVINGLRGMPGWAIGNIAIGISLGLFFRAARNMRKKVFLYAAYISVVVVSVALGILIIKSVIECLLYSQPFLIRVAKNIYAFVADVVVLIVSLPVCMVIDKPARKLFPDLICH